jgi:Bacterial PH domain
VSRQWVFRRGGPRWLILFLIWWLAVLNTAQRALAAGPALVAVLVLVEGAALAFCIGAWSSAVITDDKGITIRNMFRSRTIPWDRVVGLEVLMRGLIPGPMAAIRLTNDRLIKTSLWGGGIGVGNRATRRLIDALRREMERHRAQSGSQSLT